MSDMFPQKKQKYFLKEEIFMRQLWMKGPPRPSSGIHFDFF